MIIIFAAKIIKENTVIIVLVSQGRESFGNEVVFTGLMCTLCRIWCRSIVSTVPVPYSGSIQATQRVHVACRLDARQDRDRMPCAVHIPGTLFKRTYLVKEELHIK